MTALYRRGSGEAHACPRSRVAANLVAFFLLREGAKESLDVEGAYLEVLADTVGSVGVLVGHAPGRARRPHRRRRGHLVARCPAERTIGILAAPRWAVHLPFA